MTGTLLYVLGSCERHSKPYRRDVHPFEADTKGRLFVVDVSVKWPSNRNWQTKVLDSRKVTQQVYFVRKVIRCTSPFAMTASKQEANKPISVLQSVRFRISSAFSRQPRWPSGRASASRAADMSSIPAFAVDLFSRSSHTSDLKLAS